MVTANKARADRASRTTRRDDDLRSLAMTNLLDLHTDFAYRNPDVSPAKPAGETPDEGP